MSVIVVQNASCLRRGYYCECVMDTVDPIYHANLRSYAEILQESVDYMPSNLDSVFAKRIGQDCILSCQQHILILQE